MEAMNYPDEYIQYLAEYNGSRDYFECHEIMEEYWKEHPDSEFRTCWLVLIRIAVCLYHARRGNWTGAIKLMGKAVTEINPNLFDKLGIEGATLKLNVEQMVEEWREGSAGYKDMDLPIIDERLRKMAGQRCQELGYRWGVHGLAVGQDVIHRHLTRDRRDVVLARAESAKLKALSRKQPNPDPRL